MNRIVITGMGVVSAIGVGKEETLRSLQKGAGGVAPVRYLDTIHRECMVGEVKLSNDEMKARLGIPAGVATIRTSLLGMMALKEALEEAGLDKETDIPQMALVNGTTVGGMDKSEQYYVDYFRSTELAQKIHGTEEAIPVPQDVINGKNPESEDIADYIKTHDCGSSTELIANYIGHFAMMTSISTACSSAANAFILGARMIRSGEYERVVVGGAESLSKFHLNGFNTLMILDQQPCRPMDATRAGLNLGEGAAFLVIETEASAHARGAEILGYLDGYGNACDAFHQTASSPEGEGAYLAMQQALAKAGITPDGIDYINCHGTGTPNNDPSELAALHRVFGDQLPPFSSTKGFTGHTTSASGSIEAVFCLLAMQHQFLPVNLNWKEAIEENSVPVNTLDAVPARELNHVLCNAFGFGGNDTSLLLSRV